MRPQLYGLVLVGGKSERMGHDKALLSFDGKHTQLERAVSLLSKVTDHAFVSLRKEQEFPLPDGANAVFDNFEEIKGPLCGILSAMKAYPLADWLVVACDLPNLDTSALRKLIGAYRSMDPQLTAYKNSHSGFPEPLCAIYPAGNDSELIQLSRELDTLSPRKLFAHKSARLVDQTNPNSLDNVNTAAEYEVALQNK